MEWISVSSSQNRLSAFPPDPDHKSYPVELSVVIPTYNRADRLMDLLNCWLKADAATTVDYEVIFCDDGSEDETIKILKSYQNRLPMQILANPHAGPAKARNSGIEAARGRRLLFLGDDIYPGTDLLNLHVRLGKEFGDHVAILGRVDWHPEQKQNHLLTHITQIGHEQFCFDQMSENSFVDYTHFYTCNVSVSSKLLSLEPINFDTRFYKVNFEDTELAYRLSSHGMQVFYAPAAHALHFHEYEVEGFCRRQETAGEMATVFGKLHPVWDQLLGISDLKQNYDVYLELNGYLDQPVRQLSLIHSSCRLLENKLEKNPGNARLRKILSLIYLQLFKFKFEEGILGQTENYHRFTVEQFLYERCFQNEYYEKLKSLVAEELRDDRRSNLKVLIQYYLRILTYRFHRDEDLLMAKNLISDSLPDATRNSIEHPGLKKFVKEKTWQYLQQFYILTELHRQVRKLCNQVFRQQQKSTIQVKPDELPQVNRLTRMKIVLKHELSPALKQDYERELGVTIVFNRKTADGFEYHLEGMTGSPADLNSVELESILRFQDQSELSQIFEDSIQLKKGA
ncbi:glycosyltransferase family 2 protein [Gimesia sp.]|uniref:glycosyltransferase family 2 protein n=1 Tax=Gimesia sp. TaxID=2024833 RepID=UPI0032ED777B